MNASVCLQIGRRRFWTLFHRDKNKLYKTGLCSSSHSINRSGGSFLNYSSQSIDLSGIFPPITTPFLTEGDHFGGGDVDWDGLKSNVAKWRSYPFSGLVVQGSNGEVVLLSSEERVSIVEAVREAMPKECGKLIVAGAGCESTRATISTCSAMASAGADAVLVVTPSYYKGGMSDAALYAHFTAVADSSPIPIILYSVPANTNIDLSPEVIVKLASHPNVVGVKDSGGNVAKTALVLNKTKDEPQFQFLAGSASYLLATYHVGGAGGISALANVLGSELCILEKLFKERRYEEAASLQRRLVEPNDAVTKRFGVAGLKKALEWYGYVGGLPRAPLLPLDAEKEISLKKSFTDNGFFPP